MGSRILLLLPQMPQDPTSGAARTSQTAVEFARQAGFEVRALATTNTESPSPVDSVEYLRSAGCDPEVIPASSRGSRELRFEQRGISYTLVDTGRFGVGQWEKPHGRHFNRLFEEELESFQPDILFTYGGLPDDVLRQQRARRRGVRVALILNNWGYFQPQFFRHIDSVLTPSNFLAQRYRERLGIETTAIPQPIDFDEVVATERDPIFVTMVNPSVEKGLFMFVRLAEELGKWHPKVAVLAIESRATAGMVYRAGLAGGFDLRRHESVMIAPPVPRPRDLYTHMRVLVAPSVWEEPAGRVAAEAVINGVVPLYSNRGSGLEECANGAGFSLPLPDDLTLETRKPVSATAVKPWIDLIERLCFDEPFYQAEVAKTRVAAQMYKRESLQPKYVEFFRQVLAAPTKKPSR